MTEDAGPSFCLPLPSPPPLPPSLPPSDIGPNSVAVGVPAKVVGQTTDLAPAESMRQADAIVMVEDDLPDFII